MTHLGSRMDATEIHHQLLPSPGFINNYSHSELMVLTECCHEPKVRQRMATEATGLSPRRAYRLLCLHGLPRWGLFEGATSAAQPLEVAGAPGQVASEVDESGVQ